MFVVKQAENVADVKLRDSSHLILSLLVERSASQVKLLEKPNNDITSTVQALVGAQRISRKLTLICPGDRRDIPTADVRIRCAG